MPGDSGVAKAGDLVVFVPGTIPGDRVAIRIVKREKPATDPDMSHSRTMSARLRVRRL